MAITFYKGVLKSDLKSDYIPGTVTMDKKEAIVWMERISSRKRHGASKHIRHGESCLIEIKYHGKLESNDKFQESGISEHNRVNCWTSTLKNKAQINTPCEFKIIEGY